MLYKLCRKCKTPIKHPLTYCPECQKIQDEKQIELQRERDRRYNSKRDPKYKQFYNSNEWKTLREKKLQDEEYQCEKCNSKGKRKLATEVHHKKYIQTDEGWELRLDYDNLEALCIDCHNHRHSRFQKRKVVRDDETKTNSM